jgi:ubiquinone/menaquinone biosynthesis C-methylase UbiE
LTEIIFERSAPGKVTGVEPTEGFFSQARVKITDRRAGFKSGGAMSLPFNDSEADVLVSGLVLNFVPDA